MRFIELRTNSYTFQFRELETLGYQGFAFGFRDDDVELVGTSSALRKIDGDDIDYLHAIVRAGKLGKCIVYCLIVLYMLIPTGNPPTKGAINDETTNKTKKKKMATEREGNVDAKKN